VSVTRSAMRNALLIALCTACGCSSRGAVVANVVDSESGNEAAELTARYFHAVRNRPPLLAAFLREFPKGGDLHNHLSGAIYAERLLEWAVEGGVCIDVELLSAVDGACEDGGKRIPAAQAVADVQLRDRLIDAWSVRNWDPAMGPGHARFFGAFARFRAALRDERGGDLLADVATQAADGRVAYLELMYSPDRGGASRLAKAITWQADMPGMHAQLRAAGLDALVNEAVARVDGDLIEQRKQLACASATPAPGCAVVLRFQFAVGRARGPAEVFASLAFGFELASRDPRFVAINLVQPEDWPRALQDYALHMAMVGFLSQRHPDVGITLHAGELVPGLVPPQHLRSHIRQAIDVAGARRIGHGASIMHEDDPFGLLRSMAERGVLVEVALSSNDIILGLSGASHPLSVLLEHGVPVALVTDDEGVARSSLAQEFQRAVREHHLDYAQLKRLARNSLEYAFIEGASLWRDGRRFQLVAACSETAGGLMSHGCDVVVADSARAELQRRLELEFLSFEQMHAALSLPGGSGSH
jgi:adenosine deaminase